MSADDAAREATTDPAPASPEELARVIAGIVDDKLGEEIVALDVSSLVGYTDVLMVCTARNERQAKAIHDEVRERVKRDHGRLPATVEGADGCPLGADGLSRLRAPRVRAGAA